MVSRVFERKEFLAYSAISQREVLRAELVYTWSTAAAYPVGLITEIRYLVMPDRRVFIER